MKKTVTQLLDKFWQFIWELTYKFMQWAFPGSEVDVPVNED